MFKTLSGRFLILTILFVMVAEVFIFVPSIARFRQEYLLQRLERAQIASLALLGANEMIGADVEAELLSNAGVLNVVLRRNDMRQLVLSSPVPGVVSREIDLRAPSVTTLILDAGYRLMTPEPQVVRIVGQPVMGGGDQIEVAMDTSALRAAMIDYAVNIIVLSLVISVITAGLLFVAVQLVLVRPIRTLVGEMGRFASAPDDRRCLIEPASRIAELRAAEEALLSMERDLSQSLKQRERLAQLGEAVAKISHDLRNILTTATLMGDRLEQIEDPTVKRVAPKLVRALDRAVKLTESTLVFGRAEEHSPRWEWVGLADLCDEVLLGEALACNPDLVSFQNHIPKGAQIYADPDHLSRVLSNLMRNARFAIEACLKPGAICLDLVEQPEAWQILVRDTGPGLPAKARAHLFKAFQGTVQKGGTGLGLSIAQELTRAHGGELRLERTGDEGTVFSVNLPKQGFNEVF